MWTRLQAIALFCHEAVMDALHFPLRWRVRRRGMDLFHAVGRRFDQRVAAMQSPRILELGSRNVTGTTIRHQFANAGEYVGFDFHPGEGVEVVGDAHRLADHFEAGRFDAVIAISTFEHLLFPWKVVLDINKVLRVGGLLLVATHPTWPTHELPWDFWRFPKGAFTGLFNELTGFQIIECEEGLPARAYSLSDDPATRPLAHSHLLKQGVAVIAMKTADYRSDLLKWDIDPAMVTSSIYPPPGHAGKSFNPSQ